MSISAVMIGMALLASDLPPSLESRELPMVRIADYVTVPARTTVSRIRRVRHFRPYPVACEAVRFPRSPLCADRPYRYNIYEW
jgi:hypothetical protein